MYVITNRQIVEDESGIAQFGHKVNDKGPNELRIADVRRAGKGWKVDFLDDRLPDAEAHALIDRHRLAIEKDKPHFASLKVACDLASQARKKKTHILFFVHGYNNDLGDVLERATDLQERYKVIVVPFSWPANGGGFRGVASYKSDKRDARASAGALERALQFVHYYLAQITEAQRRELFDKATAKHPDNPQARDALYTDLLRKECPFTVNAMYHSMGNYLLKQMLKSSISEGNRLTFDNILLVAADTNNHDHDLWVEKLAFRKRCFVAINENDHALAASRMKSGSEQLARLGHYLRNLSASNAHYINFTDASWVRNSHGYFGDPSTKNDRIFEFFQRAFSGESAEDALRFHAEGNWFGF